MIKHLIAFTLLIFTFNVSASVTDGGKDKWPNTKSNRQYKLHGQPYLTDRGINYRKLRKAHRRAMQRPNRCRGAY